MAQAQADGEAKPSARRDLLLSIQKEQQKKWEDVKIFESVAPAPGEPAPEGKFFGNFPYPYMNGMLHLGHAFSLSKLEFAAAYHRLCGRRVLFPQGFHCTGMPIKACADKLDRELRTYGCPPKFPEEDEEAEAAPAAEADAAKSDPTKFSGKKSKAAAKKGVGATQWQILKQSGIAEADIPAFRDPAHWLRFFPPLAERDMRAMGCGVDWRRAFITTDMNPFYDSFVRWQFWTLYKQGRIVKDKRYAVFSPLDGQPCADHDRATGEGVGPQDYTLIKLRALELPGKLSELEGAGPVFLMAATLRPETMYGQTNCWALPEGKYGAYRGLEGEVYIMTARSALNLSYQERTPARGEPECLLQLTGQDLIGVPLAAPNCPHERVYVLPLLTILTNKGTGIVTSVPSDSPDDYTALLDLKKKPKLREKYGVKDEWVLPYEIIPIIDIPGFGDRAAQVVCEQLKVQSQNDAAKLAEAKQMVYLKGFTDGVMTVGPYAGRKVSEAKPLIRDEMLAAGQALAYSEPEKTVMSRSGDECVVALTDQWYLTYGEDGWRDATLRALGGMETYNEDARHAFTHTLGWLQQWACSRSFGLGTRLPWDEQYLIESLSDSTIYMAYYTVAHYLQNSDMYGETPGAIRPEHLTHAVWDYIFLRGPVPDDTPIPRATLDKMRAEFEFWYPFDLRVSGKDLIQNHLTFALYSHVAVWGEDRSKLPMSFRCNGHLLLNSEKMSKSTGNFKTLADAVAEYSADAMRWALADAGDALDDANFETSTANAAILRMTKDLAWIEEVLAPGAGLREGPADTVQDKVFANEIAIAVHKTKEAYDRLLFREALKSAAYDLANARDLYRFACGPEGMNRALVERYIEVSTLLLVPITPHTSEHVWTNVLKKKGSVLTAGWPASEEPDFVLQRAAQYIESVIFHWRKLIAKAEAPPKKKKAGDPLPPRIVRVDAFVAERFGGWQEVVLRALASAFDAASGSFPPTAFDSVGAAVKAAAEEGVDPSLEGMNDKQLKALTMPFAKFRMEDALKGGLAVLDVKLPFDEAALLRANEAYLLRALGLEAVGVHSARDAAAAAAAGVDLAAAYPGAPAVALTAAAAADAAVVAGRIAHTKLDAALTVANATLAAADAAKRAAAAAAADAAVVAGRIAHAKVDAALTVANATLAAAQAAKKAASDAAAVASGLAVGAAQFGVGAAQLGSQAVYGGAYDVVDMMMLRPLVDAPKGFTPAGTGYCFPRWTSANVTVARIGCPPGHALSAVGCVRKTARATQTCFSGPECVAPFNATADAPVCLDDKVQEVIVGVLALHKAGLKAPYGVGRALALFSGESANASLALLRESFELHVGAAAAAVGVGSAFVGADGRALVDLGSRLMAFDWPALPDFNKLYESVNKAVRAVPEEVVDEVRAVAPACLRRCCKPDTAIDTAVARPSLTCPNGGRLEPVGLLCIGDGGAAGALPGYGKCPAGMKACLLSSWGRPLCAAQDRVLGVESCAALEVLALAHKLPKLACPGAA